VLPVRLLLQVGNKRQPRRHQGRVGVQHDGAFLILPFELAEDRVGIAQHIADGEGFGRDDDPIVGDSVDHAVGAKLADRPVVADLDTVQQRGFERADRGPDSL
jgi:hypothetical protein